MRIVLTIFGTSISPLFDSAQKLLVAELEGGKIHKLREETIPSSDLSGRLNMLTKLGTQILVCGAINRFFHNAIQEKGIQVYPWVSGEVDEVLNLLSIRFQTDPSVLNLSGAKQNQCAISGAISDLDAAVVTNFKESRYLHYIKDIDEKHYSSHVKSIQDIAKNERECFSVARLMTSEKVRAFITGRIGPNALGIFSLAGIQVISNVEGSIRDVVIRYQKRTLSAFKQQPIIGEKKMKVIAIASENNKGLDGEVSAHFGRCPYYTLVEVERDKVIGHRVEKNIHFGQHQPGIMPEFIHSLGAHVILAGGMGPMAINLFHGYGMDVATGASGKISKVVDDYLQGKMRGIVPCHHDHPESCGGHEHHEPSLGNEIKHQGVLYPATTQAKRVAITSAQHSGLSSHMDPRFGRAPYFVLVDFQSGEILDTLPNDSANEAHGAGTGAAKVMSERGIGAVIAGRFGPKAEQALAAMGIEMWTAPEGLTVHQALEKLKSGELKREK